MRGKRLAVLTHGQSKIEVGQIRKLQVGMQKQTRDEYPAGKTRARESNLREFLEDYARASNLR